MNLYTAYLDDSGTHDSSDVVVVGGLMSLPDAWVYFSEEWQAALNEFKIGHFRMSAFANRTAPYDTWSEEERRERLNRLLDIIKRYGLVSRAVAIPVESFHGIMSERAKDIVRTPYGLASLLCMWSFGNLMKPPQIDGWIEFVFESGTLGAGDVSAVFNQDQRWSQMRLSTRHRSLSFRDKRLFLPLQGADVVAYELYKQAPKFLSQARPIVARYPLQQLGAGILHEWVMVDDDTLRDCNRALILRQASGCIRML